MPALRLPTLFLFAALQSCAGTPPEPAVAPDEPARAASFEWHAWSPESFAAARTGDKILLVNVAAAWCHWCHVMDHETYADAEVAALLREHFLAIRVDSDARPDLAERYADWGWPATAVLTSDARPVLELRGYQDPREFAELLRDLVADQKAGKLTGRRPAPPPPPRDADLAELRKTAEAQLDSYYDEARGGWGRVQKYPLAAHDELSLLRAAIFEQPVWRARALTTIAGEVRLIDPVWGGMYQYSLQSVWDRPHYEKIAAVQAGALETLSRTYELTRDDKWRAAAHLQRRYVLEFMQRPGGGFYTSQDADLQRPGEPPVVGLDYYARDDAARRALGVPRIDTSVYADLNGRIIAGLCRLYAWVPGPDGQPDVAALQAAASAGERLLAGHRTASGGFTHAAGDGGLLHLRDQAAVGRGLMALYRVTGDDRWLTAARALADFMLKDLQDPTHGGFFAHTADPAAVGVFAERRKPVEENGLAARFLLELHRQLDHLSEEPAYGPAAVRALKAVSDPAELKEQGRMLGQYALALAEASYTPVDVTVVGRPGDPATMALHAAALRLGDPRTILAISPPGARYPDPGGAAVYLCTDTACSSPVKDPARLADAARGFLANLRGP
ncbi:MAG: thioredoxin domain-containing protein [Myxococcales bacterium]|nr:thioredoxin domain-containing protein [Myxococcales bacterium]